jgi:hypothetical protein
MYPFARRIHEPDGLQAAHRLQEQPKRLERSKDVLDTLIRQETPFDLGGGEFRGETILQLAEVLARDRGIGSEFAFQPFGDGRIIENAPPRARKAR